MYLAEDRILCLGLFTQIDSDYILKYVPDADAYTDAVDDFIEFMQQRRRWINSSWFALDYVLRNWQAHLECSSHPWYRKYFVTRLNMLFAVLGKFNAYILLALYYFVIHASSFQLLAPKMTDVKRVQIMYNTETGEYFEN